MNNVSPSVADQPQHLVRLRQFLVWIAAFNLCSVIFASLAFVTDHRPATAVTALVLLAGSLILLRAQRQVRGADVRGAVQTIFAGLVIADIVIAVVQPFLWPTLVLIPLLAVMVVLPTVEDFELRWMIGIGWLVTAVVLALGDVVPARDGQVDWAHMLFRDGALMTVVTLVLLLLWQFRSRLIEMLRQTRTAEERYALAANGANDGLWDWDLVANTVFYSPRWKAMLSYADAEIGATADAWMRLVHPDDIQRVSAELAVHRDGLTEHFESEYRVRCADGSYLWVLCRGLAVRDAAGRALRIAGSQTDISRRKSVEAQLLHDAVHDALTGLPNRAYFLERLGRAVTRFKYQPQYAFATLFLDLDRFKVINDSLGHSIGDELLQAVARRLEQCVRPDDIVARLGGDEFTILIGNIGDAGTAIRVAERINAALAHPFVIEGHEIFTSASIGIAINSSIYHHPADMLRDADTALYRAKELGKAQHVLFDQSMHLEAVALMQLETDLRRAVEREEFLVYYHPIVSLRTGRLAGFEALVRWQHPERGLVSPAEFVPVAEETGLIGSIGWLVLREAARQMRDWQQRFGLRDALTISVNVSARQFGQTDLIAQVDRVLHETGLDPQCLRLEITESVMMEAAAPATRLLTDLRLRNVRLHIDDFGTGYSSLAALHNFPIDALKIDRAFVSRLGGGEEPEEIVRTIVTLGHNLGKDVIAEGVETYAQLLQLKALGCDYAQGYWFARPLDRQGAEALIADDRTWALVDPHHHLPEHEVRPSVEALVRWATSRPSPGLDERRN